MPDDNTLNDRIEVPSKIVLATGNRGKAREISSLAKGTQITFVSLADIPDAPDVEEDGETFEDNALKKARELARFTGLPALADDSGLCVDALEGRPGVLSARYAGENASDEDRLTKLLDELENVPDKDRTARFECVVALVRPDGKSILFKGKVEGVIVRQPKGHNGFGYDPVFFYAPAGRTFAEMSESEKNLVSHRGEALRKFESYLRGLAQDL